MNETILKFGYPENLLREYEHWVVLIRPVQLTAGCMVLACKEDAQSMAAVSSDAFAELPLVTGDIETCLRRAFGMEKINYIMLMMVDKEVHFHVVPRYSEDKSHAGATFNDPGWPALPDMKNQIELTGEQFDSLREYLKESL